VLKALLNSILFKLATRAKKTGQRFYFVIDGLEHSLEGPQGHRIIEVIQLLITDPSYKKRVEDMERLIYTQSLALQQKKVTPRSKANYILPVVIHLIVPPGTNVGQGNNLTDAQVEQGLDYLNQPFSN